MARARGLEAGPRPFGANRVGAAGAAGKPEAGPLTVRDRGLRIFPNDRRRVLLRAWKQSTEGGFR